MTFQTSSKDDWIRVLVHLSGLELLARSLNSEQITKLVENGAKRLPSAPAKLIAKNKERASLPKPKQCNEIQLSG